MAAIQIRDLRKTYGAVKAVDGLSFDVEPGTVVGFLGPNGAGKTTTLRILLGLVGANSGSATINGKSYADLSDPLRHVGAVLEASSFYPGRSARNHLRIQAMAGGIAPTRVDEVLQIVGLSDAANRKVAGFSLGMRQRLGIAGALLGDPDVLILDEPANGLDPEGVRWLRELVRDLAKHGRTVLVSSHILAEVAQTVDSVVIIDKGRLVAHSTLDELTASTSKIVHVRTPNPKELSKAVRMKGVSVTPIGKDRLEISGTTPEDVGYRAAKMGIPIFESTTEVANLEDIFFQLTANDIDEVAQ
ncbi:MAG: ABC transporter ATP-binding protein [Actinomycetota bacterium]